jgi:hypothetical protein
VKNEVDTVTIPCDVTPWSPVDVQKHSTETCKNLPGYTASDLKDSNSQSPPRRPQTRLISSIGRLTRRKRLNQDSRTLLPQLFYPEDGRSNLKNSNISIADLLISTEQLISRNFFPLAIEPQFGPWPTSMKLAVSHRFTTHSEGLLGRAISSSQGLYLYTNTKHPFEPTIPASDRAKTISFLYEYVNSIIRTIFIYVRNCDVICQGTTAVFDQTTP